jgi:hypothetical protein
MPRQPHLQTLAERSDNEFPLYSRAPTVADPPIQRSAFKSMLSDSNRYSNNRRKPHLNTIIVPPSKLEALDKS